MTDVIDSKTFEATQIWLGTLKCEPVEKVLITDSEVRIIMRNPTKDANIIFATSPARIVKTICHFGKESTILFRILGNEMESLLKQCSSSLEATDLLCQWIFIQSSALTEANGLRFSNIFKNFDIISSHEMENMIDLVFSKRKSEARSDQSDRSILKYPPDGKGAISISVKDYECLAVGEHLNDIIIDFYMEYLRCEVLTPEQRERTHMFSTFFYVDLTRRRRSAPERVQKWTKDTNIFQKDFVIVPINKNSHWYLAIICFPSLKEPVNMHTGDPLPRLKRRSRMSSGPKSKRKSSNDKGYNDDCDIDYNPEVAVKRPCILMFDSLGGSKDTEIKTIRDYLTREYQAKMKDDSNFKFDEMNMPGQNVRVPSQPNLEDCGLFLLQNVEQFFKDPIKSYELPLEGLRGWYEPDTAIRKRRTIATLIQKKKCAIRKYIANCRKFNYPTNSSHLHLN